MTKAFLLRELLDAVVSRKLLWISILCCLPIPLSVLVNQRALDQFTAYQARAQMDYERSKTGFLATDQIEVRAFRPKSSLAGLAFGLESTVPNTVLLRRDGMSIGQGQAQENPIASLFGRIDMLFVVRFILSLAAIILTFNAICGEKEQGTLSLIFSSAVPRDSFLFGKYLGAFVVLIGPFAASLLLALLVLQIQAGGSLARAEDWIAVALIFVVSTLYLMTFLTLGVLVSAFTSRPLVAIIVLLFLWAGLVAVIPQSAGLLAELVFPMENAESFLFKKNLVTQEFERQRSAELEPYFGAPDYEEIRRPIALKYAVELAKITAEMDREYSNRRQAQFRIASAIASVSPVTPLTLAVSALAGTGVPQENHFYQALNQFQGEVQESVFSGGYRDVAGGTGQFQVQMVALKDLPRFELGSLSLSRVLRDIVGTFLLLIVFNAALFLLAYFRFLRYELS